MKIKVDKESGIITFVPDKMYPNGHDLEISFCDDYVCFSISKNGSGPNAHISYDEWRKIRETLLVVKEDEKK